MTDTARAEGLHDQLDRVLAVAVESITGSTTAKPRPGQVNLSHDILNAMIGSPEEVPGHVSGAAPTGVGKSLAGLAPAFLMAVMREERTVISTHSLALMSQIHRKDSPVVADAVEQVCGKRPTLAVLKGFSNSVCTLAAQSAATDFLGVKQAGKWDLDKLPLVDKDAAAVRLLRGMRDAVLTPVRASRRRNTLMLTPAEIDSSQMVKIGETNYPRRLATDLLAWALEQASEAANTGDRADFTGQLTDQIWSAVSVTPGDCIGVGCPLIGLCRPRQARKLAAESDVVVTNHAILGVQAAMQVPVILGSKTLGNFDHLIVDEAHELPGVVRNSGAKEISARRVMSAARALEQTIVGADGDHRITATSNTAQRLSERLEDDLATVVHNAHVEPGTGVKFDHVNNPLVNTGEALRAWCDQAAALCPSVDSQPNPKSRLKIKRLKTRIKTLADDLDTALGEDVETVRWVEQNTREGAGGIGTTLRLSPVDVSGLIMNNLFQAKWLDDNPDTEDVEDGPKESLSVTMMSATIPISFRRDSGIRAQTREYESPFDDAYDSSMAHCPRLRTDADLDRVSTPGYGGKRRFDATKHMRWAAERIIDMVATNGGSALVLSANRAAGLEYTARLRAELDESITVHSQWDGRDPRHIADEWRADPTSVMVGTRSFMTGVDAPGETCTLVIVDRVPRAAGNVVDDARVELLMKNQMLNKWDAERFVYVADAALLLEQAAGRLVRSISDSGMFACLDPRLVPGTVLSYPRQTSDVYLKALRRFKTRKVEPADVAAFLTSRTGTVKEVA